MKTTILFFSLFLLQISCSTEKNSSKTDELYGNWKLTAFVNEQSGTSIEATDPNYYDPVNDTEVQIIINFKDNFSFEGSTSRNTFSGSYTLNNTETVIIFEGLSETEVNETDFGNLFFDNLNLNYSTQSQKIESSFELNNDIFKLFYSENEYMKFERI